MSFIPRKAAPMAYAIAVLALTAVTDPFTGEAGTARAEEPERYLPMVRAAPMWPHEAPAAPVEGRVVVAYTVTAGGTLRDIVILESSHPMLEQPALRAVERFRYRPRIEDGKAVDVPGGRVIFEFKHDPPGGTAEVPR